MNANLDIFKYFYVILRIWFLWSSIRCSPISGINECCMRTRISLYLFSWRQRSHMMHLDRHETYTALLNSQILKKQGLNPHRLHSFILFQKINWIWSTLLCEILWKICSAARQPMFCEAWNTPQQLSPKKVDLTSAVRFFSEYWLLSPEA